MSASIRTYLARARQFLKGKGPFVVLACVIALLLSMAGSLAVRSGVLGFSGEFDSKNLGVFLAFIGASLGTAATVFAALLTRAHNGRERERLQLDSVIKSLESIPPEAAKARLAGVLSTMVLSGHRRIAVRVLKPAWDDGDVDAGTATWIIGQVLVRTPSKTAKGDERVDENAVKEAATLLYIRAKDLTDEESRHYHFPGHFMRHWKTEPDLPAEAKERLLLSIGRMLVSRDESWWCPDGTLPEWPISVLLECVEKEATPVFRSSAAFLLAAWRDRRQKEFEEIFSLAALETISTRATEVDVPGEYAEFADEIRNRWGSRVTHQGAVVVAAS